MRSVGPTRTLVLLAVASAALAACSETKRAVPVVAPGAAATRSTAGTARDYTIIANDFAFSGLPVHARAGWLTFRMANHGKEHHMLAVIPRPARYTTAGLIDSVVHSHLPADVKSWAGVDVVGPGDTGVVTSFYPPGEYVVGCFVQSPDGRLHVQKGMVGSFDVVASSDTGSAPRQDAAVTLSPAGISVAGPPLRRGIRVLRIVSTVPLAQDFQILKLIPGHSAQDALRWYTNRTTVPPAATTSGGISGIAPGQKTALSVNFAGGHYLMIFPVNGYAGKPDFITFPLAIPGH
jgi:hypothetical protein